MERSTFNFGEIKKSCVPVLVSVPHAISRSETRRRSGRRVRHGLRHFHVLHALCSAEQGADAVTCVERGAENVRLEIALWYTRVS